MAMDTLRRGCFRAFFLLLLWVVWLQTSPCGFGRTSQRPLSELREGTSLEIHESARGSENFDLSSEEKVLVSDIARASDDRDWTTARSLFGEYTGSASPVYGATLHAALRCREYKEGAKIFEMCQTNCEHIGQPPLSAALRIFAKLGERTRVRQIWDDALNRLKLSGILASARIVAAAEEGDVDTAAEMLDNMTRNNVSIEEILLAYEEMKALKIEPDRVFAETYLFSLLQSRKGRRVEDQLHEISAERLQAARDALSEFRAAGVPLTRACTNIYRKLTSMGF
eukprot:Skav216933  [mRNA]  locus=scaffold546:47239:48249:- [translate_table: standard]